MRAAQRTPRTNRVCRASPTRYRTPNRPSSTLPRRHAPSLKCARSFSSQSNQPSDNNGSSVPFGYFQQYAQPAQPSSKLDIASIQQPTNTNTTYREAKKQRKQDPIQNQEHDMKLGKHKSKRRLEQLSAGAQVSKSLALAMKTGQLPTLLTPIQNSMDDMFQPLDQQQSQSTLLSFAPHQEDDLAAVYGDSFIDASKALLSNDVSDLKHIRLVNDAKTAASHKSKSIDGDAEKNDNRDVDTARFPTNGAYSSFEPELQAHIPRETDIAAAATAVNWFPGHMKKALDDMADKIRHVPIAIEVRDARVPLSSANPLLDSLTGNKIKIIVLNKTDLIKKPTDVLHVVANIMGLPIHQLKDDAAIHPLIMQSKPAKVSPLNMQLGTALAHHAQVQIDPTSPAGSFSMDITAEDEWFSQILQVHPNLTSLPEKLIPTPHIISPDRRLAIVTASNNNFTTVKSLLMLIKALAPEKKWSSLPTTAMICGFPNVGKSTIINNLKVAARMILGKEGLEQGQWSLGSMTNTVSKSRAKIGPLPGVTRHIQGFKVSRSPPIVIIDSPGIMVPRFDRSPAGIALSYKLALVRCISDTIADPRSQCEQLLHLLNSKKQHAYAQYYEVPLSTPLTDLQLLLFYIIRKEKLETQTSSQWRERLMKSRFGRILPIDQFQTLVLKSRQREQVNNIHLGALLNRYARKKNTHVDIRDFSSNYLFPSKDELRYDISPDLEDLALRAFLKSYRSGSLGRFILD